MKFQITYLIAGRQYHPHCDDEETANSLFEILRTRHDVTEVVVREFVPGAYHVYRRYDVNIVPATCYEPGNPIDPRD